MLATSNGSVKFVALILCISISNSAQSAGLDCQTSHVWFYNFFTRQSRICYDPHPQTLQEIRQDQTKHKPMNLGIFWENISIHSLDNKILFHTIYSATKLISLSKTTKRRWLCYFNGIYFVLYHSTLMLSLQGRVVWKSCTALALTCHSLLEKIIIDHFIIHLHNSYLVKAFLLSVFHLFKSLTLICGCYDEAK